MQYFVVTCLVIVGLCWTSRSHGQTEPQHQIERQDADALGSLSPDLVSKIRELAMIVQKKLADGQISDATIQRELQGGDVGAVIRGLGPDANRLLDEIKASFQSNYSEESLALLLQALTSSSPHSR
ncbi:MAG: hypothetical protein ABI945_08340 [Nitrospirales bacterium]